MKYCMAPFRGIYINNNKVRPCCWYDRKDLKNNANNLIDALDIFNSSEFDEIRQNQDEPTACKKCQMHEKNGGMSHRHLWNNRYTDDNTNRLEMLDIYMGNLCNISCIMCSSNNSTKWIREEKKLFGKAFRSYQEDIDLNVNYELVKNVKRIKLAGGEPLIIPQLKTFMKQLIELDVAKNIKLSIITNNTQDPKKYEDYFKHFKQIEFILSVDGFGEVNDYIRYGSDWDTVNKNIETAIDMGIEVSINCVVSILNVYHLPKLIDWWNGRSHILFRILDYPSFLSIKNLTEYEREKTIKNIQQYSELQHICNYLKKEYGNERHVFEEWITKLDNNRKNNFWKINEQFSSNKTN